VRVGFLEADFLRYARRVVGEVLSVGREGSLVLWDDSPKRPCVSFWRTEDIINWAHWGPSCSGRGRRKIPAVCQEFVRRKTPLQSFYIS